ncbi:hypothetical protein [Stenotrophomonas phage RAS14]
MFDKNIKHSVQESAWFSALWFKESNYDMPKYIHNLRNNTTRELLKDKIKLIMFYLDSMD